MLFFPLPDDELDGLPLRRVTTQRWHPLRRVATKNGGHRERVSNTMFCKKKRYMDEFYKTGSQKLGTNVHVSGHMLNQI